jgi:fructan beta-fructosidase
VRVVAETFLPYEAGIKMIKKALLLLYVLMLVQACNTPLKKTSLQSEPHRPQVHFTPPSMWMNDPNGMVFYEGEYHLFYQYYPKATVWGPMHWGHAVSKNLVHWEHLPIALYPDSLGLIFSGSAVIDWNNTSGFGKNGKPPMVAIFTQHLMEGEKQGRSDFQYQSIAYSNDKGRTWTKYAGNPVIPNTDKIKDFRDPKVIWDENSRQWIMVFAAQDHVKLWGSQDLKSWKHLSDFGQQWGAHTGVWECPDLFPMMLASPGTTAPLKKKWVLLQSINPGAPNGGSGTQYFVGDFDGKNFVLDPDFAKSVANGNAVWLDYGRDNYAGVTWSDIPKNDGRRIFMGWMSNWDYATVVPTEKWRSAMTLPRTLVLKTTHEGLRLVSQPVKELETLRLKKYSIENQPVNNNFELSKQLGVSSSSVALLLEVELPEKSKTDFAVVLYNAKGEEYRIGFDQVKNEYYSDRTKAGNNGFSNKFATTRHYAPRLETSQTLSMHLVFDVASCELFADDGSIQLTDTFFPTADFTNIKLSASSTGVKIKSAILYPLKSIW